MNARLDDDPASKRPLADFPRVEFWAPATGHFWLSNFYPAAIRWGGLNWPTSEHLYQALKCPMLADRERIRLAPTPKQAKACGREFGRALGVAERAHLMRVAIREKFQQHAHLADRLMSTRGLIVEASSVDSLWGVGPSGDGLNLMGLLLMELRDGLRARSAARAS